jgi:hypothetical protein
MLRHRLYFPAMTNQQLFDSGNRMMDDTDQAIERSKKVGLYLKIILLCNKFLHFVTGISFICYLEA